MEHLLTAWPEIEAQLRDASQILLLADYDGVLSPIVARPEMATLPENTRRLLEALARQRRITLGIISGRALIDLVGRVNIDGIVYAGNHGLEMKGPRVDFISPLAQEIRPIVKIIGYILDCALRRIKGVIVEDKGLTLSVHYRQVDAEKEAAVKEAVAQVTGGARAAGKVKVTEGKKVLEVRPAVNWDKGKAVRLLIKRFGQGGKGHRLVPIFLGDDRTDEDGFAAIGSNGDGISVFVGEPAPGTAARYFLKSTDEVAQFLDRLLEHSLRSAA